MILYGDGLHDDADALKAYFLGEFVEWAGGTPVSEEIIYKQFWVPGGVGQFALIPHSRRMSNFNYNRIWDGDEPNPISDDELYDAN